MVPGAMAVAGFLSTLSANHGRRMSRFTLVEDFLSSLSFRAEGGIRDPQDRRTQERSDFKEVGERVLREWAEHGQLSLQAGYNHGSYPRVGIGSAASFAFR
jgi:hypothetical protein